MRIGVLEWASCGEAVGMALPPSIEQEGLAMCQALIASLIAAGHEPVSRLGDQAVRSRDELNRHRLDVYSDCDATIVIAPESDNILRDLLKWFRKHGLPCCNCDDAFVAATSDKWTMARILSESNFPHPPTYLLAQFDDAMLDSSPYTQWVIKPRDGAGCDGIARCDSSQLMDNVRSLRVEGDRWIVQPWIDGQAYSRSAIVDRTGKCHWLPVARQDLDVGSSVKYRGGSIEPEFPGAADIEKLLSASIRTMPGKALGWTSVDFLWNESDPVSPITVIEINPRLTTSFVGMSTACRSLAGKMVDAWSGNQVCLPTQWERRSFRS